MGKGNFSKLGVFMMAVAVAVIMAAPSGANARDFKNYGRIGVGANIPTEDLDDAGYDAGVDAAVTYGRYLTKYLVIEGGFNFFYAYEEFSGSTGTAGVYDRDDLLEVSAILITLKGEVPLGPVKLYAGGGFGGYYALLTSDIDTQYLGNLDADDSDGVFGAHVVVGGSYDITSRVFLGLEGLYRWTDSIDLSDTVGTVPVRYSGDLDGYSIIMTAGFRF